ncbi:hypothetical protein Fmac_010610 [Flemingia macrophylla]|uniref:Fungal lipase-type domain-containing protein n=1 Tax=Flemingia macrophylla TaxID=520843 RepID=A0ABD1MK38_9FABA
MLPAMTYYAVPTSLNSFATMDIITENKILLHSLPSKGVCKHSKTIRSNSSSHKCYSLSSIQATSMQPNHKSSHSEASRDMNMRQKQKGINIEENTSESSEEMINKANWVHRLMEIKTYWRGKLPKESMDPDIVSKRNMNNECDCDEDDSFCVEDYEEENGQGVICDRDSFSKFLVPVSWSDTKLFSKLVLLCNMAYAIPQIKAKDLKRYHGLQFVTSSLEKKGDVTKIKANLDQDSICVPMDASVASQDDSEKGDDNEQNNQTKDLVSLASMSQQHCGNEDFNGKEDSPHEEANETLQVHESKFAVDVAALTMTIVAAAGTAKDLQIVRSSSCEWFVCDDPKTHTRYFVIQGSYSVASWQANISFEPTTFEDTDVLVHSGIYEAAKGIYEQFMPEIMNHLKRQGENAKFQFTGHSLGGSLSFLVYNATD